MRCHATVSIPLLAAALALAAVVLAAVAAIGAPIPGPAPAPTRDSNGGGRQRARTGTSRAAPQPRQQSPPANRASGGGNGEKKRSFIGRMTDRMFRRNKKADVANRPPTPHPEGIPGGAGGGGGRPAKPGRGGNSGQPQSYKELHGLSSGQVYDMAVAAHKRHAESTNNQPGLGIQPKPRIVTQAEKQDAAHQLGRFSWERASEQKPRPNQVDLAPEAKMPLRKPIASNSGAGSSQQPSGAGRTPAGTGGGGSTSYQQMHGLSNWDVRQMAIQAQINHAAAGGNQPSTQPSAILKPVSFAEEQEVHNQLNSFSWPKASEVRPRPNQEPVSPTDDRKRG
ncbi:hypothetical protein HK405_014732 [Cladochytrium tenue]|nr:hypothetical protein HK405_014732 [Cladochytrium tenue]